jgi:hypothetical protein
MSGHDKRNGSDRRSGIDRRQMKPLHLKNTCFLERRQFLADRRSGIEPRTGWTRINKWSSAYIGITISEAINQ